MVHFPVKKNHKESKETIVCLPYDINDIYAFFCARYGNIKWNDLMNMGYDEFTMKLNSIPENEPLHKIFKSRAINLAKIKDKEERKYWRELKRSNKIPDIYLMPDELNERLKEQVKNGGIKNAR